MTGLALAGIPAGTGAPASPVVVALAWLAAVAVVVLLFGAVCAIAACLLSSRTSQAEEAREPPRGPAPVGAERAPVMTATRSNLFILTPGELPVPLNPLGRSEADMRLRS